MKYDDASWHYGGNYPGNLPDENASTHIGMFLAWCLLNNLAGEIHTEEFPDDLEELMKRKITPGAYLRKVCDEKFTDEDLNQEGNEFAREFYKKEGAPYLGIYERILGQGVPNLYEVPDTWDSFDMLDPEIRRGFYDWKGIPRPKSEVAKKGFWKFWK